eukprot:6212735-Pleurochrysis_carterae.AAC.6
MEARSIGQAFADVPRAVPRTDSPWREPRQLKGGDRGGMPGKQRSRACLRQVRTTWSVARALGRRSTAVAQMAADACRRRVERHPTLGRRVRVRARGACAAWVPGASMVEPACGGGQ